MKPPNLPRLDRRFCRRGFSGLAAALLLGGWLSILAAPKPPELPPLNTVRGSPRLPGKFVWADLVTDDALKAQEFYTKLFGWKFWSYGDYLIGSNEDRPLCGMFQRPRPKDRAAEPRWFGYISVNSVDKAQSAVTKAGGRVLAEPKKMPKRGEQAVFADAEGALFGVIKSSSGDAPDFLADNGDWIWIQLLSRDARKSAAFYCQVAGYQLVDITTSNRLNDVVLTSERFARATIRTIPGDDSKVKPTWLPYVRVKSVPETAAKAKQLGGRVLIEPSPQALDGKVAVIADPTGAAIGIMEWQEGMLKGGK
jgi:predicted enzyme related to lactoylglutathione lyase